MPDDLDHRAATLASVSPRFRDSPRRPLPAQELLLLVGCQGKSGQRGGDPPPANQGLLGPPWGALPQPQRRDLASSPICKGASRAHLPDLLIQNLADPASLCLAPRPPPDVGGASAGCVRSRPRTGSDLQKFIARVRGRKPAPLSPERGREEGWVASWSARAVQTKCHSPRAPQQNSAPSSGGCKSTLSVWAVRVPSEPLLGLQVATFCSVLTGFFLCACVSMS